MSEMEGTRTTPITLHILFIYLGHKMPTLLITKSEGHSLLRILSLVRRQMWHPQAECHVPRVGRMVVGSGKGLHRGGDEWRGDNEQEKIPNSMNGDTKMVLDGE